MEIRRFEGKSYTKRTSGTIKEGDLWESAGQLSYCSALVGGFAEHTHESCSVWRPCQVRDVSTIDAKHFELANELINLLQQEELCNLALDNSADRITLAFALVNSGLVVKAE